MMKIITTTIMLVVQVELLEEEIITITTTTTITIAETKNQFTCTAFLFCNLFVTKYFVLFRNIFFFFQFYFVLFRFFVSFILFSFEKCVFQVENKNLMRRELYSMFFMLLY